MEEYVCNSTTGKRDVTESEVSMNDKLRRTYFSILDRFISEFDRRFTDNSTLLNSLDGFDNTNNPANFLDLQKCSNVADCYSMHIDEVIFASQVMATKALVATSITVELKEDNLLMDLYTEVLKLPAAHSEIIKLLQIILTLPVSTASNERFFSVLKRVKSFIRSTTGDERLTHLMLMAVEQKLVRSFDLEDLVDDFGKLRERRYPLFD